MDLPAAYNDGRSAVSRRVGVRLEAGSLVILDAEGAAIGRWPAAEVRLVDRPGGGQAVRLRCGFDRDDRLTLSDENDLARLSVDCPNLLRTTPGWRGYWRPVVLWGAVALLSVVLLVVVLVPLVARQVAFAVPAALEERLGERVSADVIGYLAASAKRDAGRMVCGGRAGQAALDRLAARLAAALGEPPRVTVTVVESPMVNAFALPGGRILVLRGLIDFAENGGEMAGVLAHEIGHVVRRHPLAVALERAGTSLVIGLLLGDVFGGTLIAGIGQLLVGAAYGRDAEREADAVGAEIMDQAGFDVAPFAAFLERMKRQAGDAPGLFALFSTHPPSAERADAVRQGGGRRGSPFDKAEWEAVKAICAETGPANPLSG